MKFAVLSLNPGIDRVLYLNNPMNPGHMNRACRSVTSQGSKGANVAIMLKRLGFDVTYYSFTGGLYGSLCEEILNKEGIDCKYRKAACGIRVNTKVIDGNGVCTELNEKGGPVTKEELEGLLEDFLKDSAETVFMCGSFPQGVEKDVYKSLIRVEKELGHNVILDCDGEAMTQGIVSGPDIIKPNIDELIMLLKSVGMCKDLPDESGKDTESTEKACGKLAERFGVGRVICTLGENGAVENSLSSSDGEAPKAGDGIYVPAYKSELLGFSGAGDCFLAGFGAAVYGMGMSDYDALEFASACGAAKVRLEGTRLPEKKEIQTIYGDIKNGSQERNKR
ncbi:MAG: PfkB family carbohydrate kinase [Oscillospiraceae bacterium]|nr:PfkB family carbohydrate kinase [Oscillospiraceae bacterium]MCQ2427802.1 PfkB family carbohydrate kinase [Clostridia bacterium]